MGPGPQALTARDVLVIDEAGMVGTRQMERVLSHAAEAGVKVVLMGDLQQLQAIEAGAAFRAIHERHGGVKITEVRRQKIDWRCDTTRQLATGRTGEAIGAYGEHDMLHAAEMREQARRNLLDRWERERAAEPQASRIILTHTNDEVRELNQAARDQMRLGGQLGDDVLVKVERGDRQFAAGDRIMFLKNERSLGVRNGTLATIEQVHAQHIAVRTDDGHSVAFGTRDYAHIDHGYAATIHKAQGMTVDRTHVLATPGMDSHAAYVALSRHRASVQIHYGKDDFADQSKLVRALSRERAKEMATDYERAEPAQAFAERRGITFRERVAEIARKVPEKVRDMFDGLRLALGAQDRDVRATSERERDIPSSSLGRAFADFRPTASAADPEKALQTEREQARRLAVERHARAVADIWKMQNKGLPVLPHQRTELGKAREALNQTGRHAARDMEQAYSRDPELVSEASGGRVRQAIRAMQLEAEIRTDPYKRADRFVEGWRQLLRRRNALQRDGDYRGAHKVAEQMVGMAKSLERDAQVESLLCGRRPELGIDFVMGRKLVHELAISVGIELERSRGLGR